MSEKEQTSPTMDDKDLSRRDFLKITARWPARPH